MSIIIETITQKKNANKNLDRTIPTTDTVVTNHLSVPLEHKSVDTFTPKVGGYYLDTHMYPLT